MQIGIVNSNCSKLTNESEAKMLRTSFLLCDQVVNAGQIAFFFSVDEFLTFSDKIKHMFLSNIIPIVFEEKDMLKLFNNFVGYYNKYNSKKHKSKSELLDFIKVKNAIKSIEDSIREKYNHLLEIFNLSDLKPFITGEKDSPILTEMIPSSDTPSQLNMVVNSLLNIILPKDCFIMLDKTVFSVAGSNDISKDGLESVPLNPINHFIYDEICALPSLDKISGGHLSVLRNNFLSGSGVFRYTMEQIPDLLKIVPYNKEASEALYKTFEYVEKFSTELEDIKRENLLLKGLQERDPGCTSIRIYLAITSYQNLLNILENFSIIDTRVNLFLREEIKQYANLKNCRPFLIFEEESK